MIQIIIVRRPGCLAIHFNLCRRCLCNADIPPTANSCSLVLKWAALCFQIDMDLESEPESDRDSEVCGALSSPHRETRGFNPLFESLTPALRKNVT